jgi:hypothetical protein
MSWPAGGLTMTVEADIAADAFQAAWLTVTKVEPVTPDRIREFGVLGRRFVDAPGAVCYSHLVSVGEGVFS